MVIVDTRLLFSVALRDDIFNYVIAYFDIFGRNEDASISLQHSNSTRTLFDRSGQKATVADFLHDSRELNKKTMPSGLLREIRSESMKRMGEGEENGQPLSACNRSQRNTRVLYRVVQVARYFDYVSISLEQILGCFDAKALFIGQGGSRQWHL